MLESKIQAKLIKQLEADGWYVIKLIQTNKPGIPDLICIKQNQVQFIEIKAPNGKLSALQQYRIQELSDRGIAVSVHQPKK